MADTEIEQIFKVLFPAIFDELMHAINNKDDVHTFMLRVLVRELQTQIALRESEEITVG